MTGTFLFVIDTISILFMGDIMQHRQQIHSAHIPGTDSLQASSYDYSPYFANVQHFIDEADFTVANMEFCLGGPPYTGYPSFSAPESLAEEAADAGIDLFLCANNHICDKGRRGLVSSFEKYGRTGVPITGIYRDSLDEAAGNPYITDIKGARIAFINFTYGTNGIRVPEPFIVNMMDREEVRKAVKRAQEHGADIIIALPHWGQEYTTVPDRTQKEWEKFLLECGVDVIIGTHPHVIQPVEFPTAFSLGNFISNMSLRNTEMGLMLMLRIAITSYGFCYITGFDPIPIWSSRPGGYCGSYTVLPVEEFLNRKDEFQSEYNYNKMKDTYNRLKTLFEDE